jgi:hypothetical protein
MYDNRVCQAGAGFCLVVGGTVIAGWWVIAMALVLVGIGLVAARYLFRRNAASPSGHVSPSDYDNSEE